MPVKIGIVDDHKLFAESLAALISCNIEFHIVVIALNGIDLQKKLAAITTVPDIMLVDVQMPHMDGFETATWLKERYPDMKLVAVSMKNDELTIIKMLRAGCCSYLLKDIEGDDLYKALMAIYITGRYNGDANSVNSRQVLVRGTEIESLKFTEQELTFLHLACSDLTYKEIGTIMNVSERTIEHYRNHLCEKLKVGTRVGLCLEAVSMGLVEYKRKEVV